MINRKTALRLWEALGDGRDSVTNTSMIALRWVGWDPNESIKLFNEFLDQSTESFQEEDHPRDRDGKFTDKDGGEPIKSVSTKDFIQKWTKYGDKTGFYSGFIQDLSLIHISEPTRRS